MPIHWNDLEHAFLAADSGKGAGAWINSLTGDIRMDLGGAGNGPPPEDEEGWLAMPDGRDLDLKQRLVWRFVAAVCPSLEDGVQRCFSRRGAWRAYKALLADHGLLDRWYDYQGQATREALLAWAAGQGVTVLQDPSR